MGKKGNKGNKQKSARGHVKSLTYRYREKKVLIPIDDEGNPVDESALAPPPTPTIPSERRKLAAAMLEQTGSAGPEAAFTPQPELPANVVSLCQRRAAEAKQPAGDVEVTASNEVSSSIHTTHSVDETSEESSQDTTSAQAIINYDKLIYHEWANRQSLYVSKKEQDALDYRRMTQFWASHPNGKNDPPNDFNDLDSKAMQKSISTVHNPGISSTPVKVSKVESGGYAVPANPNRGFPVTVYNQRARGELKAVSTAPSGRPISEFLEGGKYAPPVKQQSPVVHPVVQRRRDKKPFGVSTVPNAWAAEDQLQTMLNMVSEHHWPKQLESYLFKDGDVWRIHTGLVRQSIAKGEDRIIARAVALAFIQQANDTDEYISVLEGENKFLHQENKIISFELAHHNGDKETQLQLQRELYDWTPQGARKSVREMDQARNESKYATAYAKPPEDVGKLVAEFKQFTAHVQSEGLSIAYSRFMYGSPDQAARMEAEVTRRQEERAAQSAEICKGIRLRVLLKQIPVMLEITKQRSMVLKRRKPMLSDEVAALKRFRRQSAKRNHHDSMYYSGLKIVVSDNTQFKVTTDGREITSSCYSVVSFLKPHMPVNTANNWMHSVRGINKTVHAKHWSTGNPSLVPYVDYRQLQYKPKAYMPLITQAHNASILHLYKDCFDECLFSVSYENWWREKAELCELNYQKNTPIGRVVFPVARAFKKLHEIGQINIDPWSRKKDREAEAARLRKKSAKAERKAEQRMAQAQAAREADEIHRRKEAAKRAFRNAH